MNLKLSAKSDTRSLWKKIILTGVLVVMIFLGNWGYRQYRAIYQANVASQGILYIRTGSGFQQVVDSLEKGHFLKNLNSFKWVAERKNYPNKIQPGAYLLKKGWNNNQLVNLLRSGIQTPVKVTFNNIRFREELAGRLSRYLEADSVSFYNELNNEYTALAMGLTCESFPIIIIPNTYEIYWNTSPHDFIDRMKFEYDRFWNQARKSKASDLGLTQLQVVTIASIVQEESNKNDEKPRIAGVYINRLKRGWFLQADPTIKYALGNYFIKRILTKYLEIDSPFNTYKHTGLPPGPINFPDISSIESVLNAEHHDFMYFCAKEDFSGYHNFARSLAEHSRNAAKYQSALNRSKIWK